MAEDREHTILRQVYELDTIDQSKSMELQATISNLQHRQVQRVINQVLDEFASTTHVYQFDQVVLDLGELTTEKLDRELPLRIESQLRSFLAQNIIAGELISVGKAIPRGLQIIDLFRHYLYYGYIPWQAGVNETPSSMLNQMLTQHASELIQLLKALGKYDHVIKRLVFQFNDDELEQVVTVLTPESAKYIIAYKEHFIAAAEHEERNHEDISRKNLRNKVWEVIFNFLLNKDEVTLNNRQHFLQALITQVALRNNETYESLLRALNVAVKGDVLVFDQEGFADLVTKLYAKQFSRQAKHVGVSEDAKAIIHFGDELRHYLKYGYFSDAFSPENQEVFISQLSHYFTEKLKRKQLSEREQGLWLKLYREAEFVSLLPSAIKQKVLRKIRTKEQLLITRLLELIANQQSDSSDTFRHQFVAVASSLLHAKAIEWKGSTSLQIRVFFQFVITKAKFSQLEVEQLFLKLKLDNEKITPGSIRKVVDHFAGKAKTKHSLEDHQVEQFVSNWSYVFATKGVERAKQQLIKELQEWEKHYQLQFDEVIQAIKKLVQAGWYDQSFQQFVETIQVEQGKYIAFEEHMEDVIETTTQSNEVDQQILAFIDELKPVLEKYLFTSPSRSGLIHSLQRIYEQYQITSAILWEWIAKDRYNLFEPAFHIQWKSLKKSMAFQQLIAQQDDSQQIELKEKADLLVTQKEQYVSSFVNEVKAELIQRLQGGTSQAQLTAFLQQLAHQYQVSLIDILNWLSVNKEVLFKSSVYDEWEAFEKSRDYQKLVGNQQTSITHSKSLADSSQLTGVEADQLITSFIHLVKSDLITWVNRSKTSAQLSKILQQIIANYNIAPEAFWKWISQDRLQLFDATFHNKWKAVAKSKAFKKLVEKNSRESSTKRRWKHIHYVFAYGQLPWWNAAYSWGQFEKELPLLLSSQFADYQVVLKQVPRKNWLKISRQHTWSQEGFYLLVRLYQRVTHRSEQTTVHALAIQLEQTIYDPLERYGVLSRQLRQEMRRELLKLIVLQSVDIEVFLQQMVETILESIQDYRAKQSVIQQLTGIFKSAGFYEVYQWLEQQVVQNDGAGDQISQLLQTEEFQSDPVKAYMQLHKQVNSPSSPLEILIVQYTQNASEVRELFTYAGFMKQILKDEDSVQVGIHTLTFFRGEQRVLYQETIILWNELKKHLSKQEADQIWVLWHTALFFYVGTGNLSALDVQQWKMLFHRAIQKVKGRGGLVQLMQRIKSSFGKDEQHKTQQLGIGWQLVELDQEPLIDEAEINSDEEEMDEVEEKPYRKLGESEERMLVDPIYVKHCGLVILAPYLARLFSMCNIATEQLKDDEALQSHAVNLLLFAATGEEEHVESDAVVAKVLCGIPIATPVDCTKPLLSDHIKAVEGLLHAVTQNWPGLQGTSKEGLRETFLQRAGKLEENEEAFLMHVEEGPFDMLLDRIPWGIGTINLSWMEKYIQVTWRT